MFSSEELPILLIPLEKKGDHKNQTASLLKKKYASQPDNKYEPIRVNPDPGKPKLPYYKNTCKQAILYSTCRHLAVVQIYAALTKKKLFNFETNLGLIGCFVQFGPDTHDT